MVSVININDFIKDRRKYLEKNQEKISTNTGFILDSIIRIILKQLRYDLKVHYSNYTLPLLEVELKEDVLKNQ